MKTSGEMVLPLPGAGTDTALYNFISHEETICFFIHAQVELLLLNKLNLMNAEIVD